MAHMNHMFLFLIGPLQPTLKSTIEYPQEQACVWIKRIVVNICVSHSVQRFIAIWTPKVAIREGSSFLTRDLVCLKTPSGEYICNGKLSGWRQYMARQDKFYMCSSNKSDWTKTRVFTECAKHKKEGLSSPQKWFPHNFALVLKFSHFRLQNLFFRYLSSAYLLELNALNKLLTISTKIWPHPWFALSTWLEGCCAP